MRYLIGFIPVIVACSLWVVISATAAIKEKSWLWFLAALGLGFIGILFPVTVFLLSGFLIPDWKGGCPLGWWSCFHMGKLALFPLILWACAALYALDIYRTNRPYQRWIVFGIWTGALVSVACFGYGVVEGIARMVDIQNLRIRDIFPFVLWMLVPLYTACWFTFRAWQLFEKSGLPWWTVGGQTLATLPFWIGGFLWSRKLYEDLPEASPSCFVVTAASRGHEDVVGSLKRVIHHGRLCMANDQLVTLWAFEELWKKQSLRTHYFFRRIYNRVGPAVARKLNTRLKADVAYWAIKPMELGARWILSASKAGGAFRVAQSGPASMLIPRGNRPRE